MNKPTNINTLPTLKRVRGGNLFACFSYPHATKSPSRSVLLRFGRLLAAGKRATHRLVSNYQKRVAPAGVVLGVRSAFLFTLTPPRGRSEIAQSWDSGRPGPARVPKTGVFRSAPRPQTTNQTSLSTGALSAGPRHPEGGRSGQPRAGFGGSVPSTGGNT